MKTNKSRKDSEGSTDLVAIDSVDTTDTKFITLSVGALVTYVIIAVLASTITVREDILTIVYFLLLLTTIISSVAAMITEKFKFLMAAVFIASSMMLYILLFR